MPETNNDDRDPDGSDRPDKAPETPTDEPKPTPVQDPPAEPETSPYVVRTVVTDGLSSEKRHE
jgi:hypothetical protein